MFHSRLAYPPDLRTLEYLSESAHSIRQLPDLWVGIDARSEPDLPTHVVVSASGKVTDSAGTKVPMSDVQWEGGAAALNLTGGRHCGLLRWESRKVMISSQESKHHLLI